MNKPVIVALDYASETDAWPLIERLEPEQCRVKIGKELFTRSGPDFVRSVVDHKFDVFLDLKFHDIPNTVAGACRAAADLNVWMINVHASGGRAMMEAARESIEDFSPRPLLIAVTILTSLNDEMLSSVGFAAGTDSTVLRLAELVKDCGLDGVVCSPRELAAIKGACGSDFLAVTPGIRPADSASDDQQRIATPRAAIESGADYLVIGRPITRAQDPAAAVTSINLEIISSEIESEADTA